MQSGDSQNHDSAASTGKCGTPECRQTRTVVPTLLAAGRQDERSTKRCGSGGWPGPHLFLGELFLRIWRGPARIYADNRICRSDGAIFCLRTCFLGASTVYWRAFTASAQFILRFALSSLILAESFGHSVVRNVARNYGDH